MNTGPTCIRTKTNSSTCFLHVLVLCRGNPSRGCTSTALIACERWSSNSKGTIASAALQFQGCENSVFGKRCFCPLPKTGSFDEKWHKNKGLHSSEPRNRRNDENGGCPADTTRVCQTHRFRHPDNWLNFPPILAGLLRPSQPFR